MSEPKTAVVTVNLCVLIFLSQLARTKYIDGVNINLDSWKRTHWMKTLNKTLDFQQYNNLNLGCISWEAAHELATYLETFSQNNALQGKKIIELGAGLGCVGIAAACLGGDVTITDLPGVLPFMLESIYKNQNQINGTGGKARAQILTWGDSEEMKSLPKQDIILMSNIISNEQSIHPLISTLVNLSHEKTTLLICQISFAQSELSKYWHLFHKYARKFFKFTEIPCAEFHGLIMEEGLRTTPDLPPSKKLNGPFGPSKAERNQVRCNAVRLCDLYFAAKITESV